MKKILITALVLLSAIQLQAQETYTINGETYELKTEVDGTLSLLWNIIDGRHRFFVKKDTSINELTNTENNNEFITTLKAFTSDTDISYDKVKLLLNSLKDFVLKYNSIIAKTDIDQNDRIVLKTRLGFSAGITNHPFVTNLDNNKSLQAGAELEIYDNRLAKRHAAFLNLRQGFKNEDLEYTSTKVSLGYRFRFIYAKAFNVYSNLTLATFSNATGNLTYLDDMDQPITEKRSASNFDAPVIFGIGADIKVGENGFLTLSYDELFALFLENQGNFSTDFSIGYKFNL